MTKIVSNGSHWAGSPESPIEDLLKALDGYALDRTFEDFGDFIFDSQESERAAYRHYGFADEQKPMHFWGNFLNLSHVFNIYTDDSELIAQLSAAIAANKQRSDYLEQPYHTKCDRCFKRPKDMKRLCRMRVHPFSRPRELRADYFCERCLPYAVAEESEFELN